MEKNNFEIKEFNLLTDEIPEDAQVIIMASPTTDLTNAYRNSNVVAMGCGLFIDGSFLSSSAFSNKDYAIDLFTYLAHIQP